MDLKELRKLLEQLKNADISIENRNAQDIRNKFVHQVEQHFEEHEILQKTLELAYLEMQSMWDTFNKRDLLTKSIFDASQDIILTLDGSGHLIEYNKAFEILLKIDAPSSLGKKLVEVLPICAFSKDLQEFFPESAILKTNTISKRIYESFLLSTDGKKLDVLISFKKIVLREKVVFALYIKDLTSEKAAAKELEENRSQLLMSSKMSALGEMAGGMAHEINTPLAVIQMRTDEIVECVNEGSLDPETLKNALRAIDGTVKRIAKIVSGLRTFARDGRKDPLEPTSLVKVVEDTFGLCKEKFGIHGVKLEYEYAVDVEVPCRPGEIVQVLLNLLNNAYDAISESKEKWIKIELKNEENFVSIEVTDSGPEIPVDVRQKLMQPFFTTKEVGKGTGLGLSISRGIIESHNGQLLLDSNALNTCFVIRLPKSHGEDTSIKSAA